MFSKEVDFSHAPHPSVNLYVNKMDFQFRPAESVCYIIPYFPEFESELDTGAYKRLVAVDWEDPDFRDIALDMISSTIPLRLMLPPANMVNVALHLREGGNFDVDDVRFKFPLKLPPLHFYCDALKKVAALFQGQPIHCQIFTDAINPEVLVELIKKELPSGHNIQFDYRKQANDDEDNVLDDFFSLFHYDVLIRPESNFSKVPDLLHDFAVVISPKHAVLSTNGGRNSVRVDEMQTKIDEFMYQICLTRWDATDRFN
ncbi:MAG: hypothetical protein ACH350_06630 [Parachlamydiaceae bacterium]